ncbi:MAG TPA: hypothetical protein VFE31_06975 [Opitutaceae bacterium]|jgi:hypothetical protein|nr:hypothetical protein [Opitutaceae bacterium]
MLLPRLILPLLLVSLWAGCAGPPPAGNASAMPDYPTRFLPNETYRTAVPLVACVYHEPFGRIWLELQGPVSGPLPASEEPDSGGLDDTYRSFEIVPAGTLLRVLKIHPFYSYLDEGSTTELTAVMASGPYAGKPVKFARICTRVVTPRLPLGFLVRDPAYLRPAD